MFNLQHKGLKNKKNVGLLNGEITVPVIGPEGHFEVDSEAKVNALKKHYPGIIFVETDIPTGEPGEKEYGVDGYVPPTEKKASKGGLLHESELEVENSKLKLANAELKGKLKEAETNASGANSAEVTELKGKLEKAEKALEASEKAAKEFADEAKQLKADLVTADGKLLEMQKHIDEKSPTKEGFVAAELKAISEKLGGTGKGNIPTLVAEIKEKVKTA